ncbi:HupE/UreJ family protein [Prosthecodimorpha hirschii]|uniref:HupE/UreJ family protein n=1 Tax=Prosthecodimorpha hirschii TaxID=665126 RepID=UPI001FEEC8FE|nr:HupE/UreJ family protein [Prosthecomicrobium hirschii]
MKNRLAAAAMGFALVSGLALMPGAALAHTGVMPHDHSGFTAGLMHPLSGIDHLAAMVAVGLWAASLGRRAMLIVPAAFMAAMVVGAGIGWAGIELPAIEQVIAGSVVVLGLIATLQLRVPTAAASALVALFALFHGHAHGAEMPELAGPVAYGLGFLIATAALHAGGLGLGVIGARAGGAFARLPGAAVTLTGLALFAGL